jgi:membrane-associated protein
MDTIFDLLREHGPAVYALLFLYCAFKSGALPLFAGYAAQAGALDLGLVVVATFAGGYLGDEARFFAARRFGPALLAGRPRLGRMVATAQAMIARHGTAYIFFYRYPKGLRTVGALPVGLTDMPWHRFTRLNAASAALWTALLAGSGYLFGASLERAVESGWGIASVALLAIFLVVAAVGWRRMARRMGSD